MASKNILFKKVLRIHLRVSVFPFSSKQTYVLFLLYQAKITSLLHSVSCNGTGHLNDVLCESELYQFHRGLTRLLGSIQRSNQ